MRDILQTYENASGQKKINLEKSALVVGKNKSQEQALVLSGISGVRVSKQHDKYLGLHTVAGKSKKEVIGSIRERVWNKLQGWMDRLLAQARKEILIKVVIQAIPP